MIKSESPIINEGPKDLVARTPIKKNLHELLYDGRYKKEIKPSPLKVIPEKREEKNFESEKNNSGDFER